MTHKALVRRLQISCLGLDPIDPLRLLVDDVIEALRENAMREVQRLGQEIEQEPVVGITAIRTWFKDGRVVTQTLCNSWIDTTPPQQEPVAWLSTDSIGERYLCFDKPLDNDPVQPLYTAPPQRTWVGLTDENRKEIERQSVYVDGAIRMTEAKLKERNA